MALDSNYYNRTFKLKRLMFYASDNSKNESNYNSYYLNLGLGTQPEISEEMETLMALGVYLH